MKRTIAQTRFSVRSLCRGAGLAIGLFAALQAGNALAGEALPGAAHEVMARSVLQPAADADAYEDRPIRELVLQRPDPEHPGEFVPLTGTLEHLARHSIRSTPTTPFRRDVVAADISRLNRLGRFRHIEAHVQLFDDGSVAVIFTLAEQPIIQDVQVVGNRELHDQDLLAEANIVPGTPVDRFQIDRGARAIEDEYRGRGFYRARVEIDEEVLEESDIVVYRVIEGERTRVMSIRFEGNRAFTERELRAQIRTRTYFPVFERAPLDDDVLREDAAALVTFYRDRGYLDVRTGFRVLPSPDGREAIVTFIVDEGPLYTLRSINVLYVNRDAIDRYRQEILGDPGADVPYLTPGQMRQAGRRPLSDEQVTGLMAFKPGDTYGDDKLRRSTRALQDAYAKMGYVLDLERDPEPVRITTREIRDEERPEIDLLVFVLEGEPYLTGDIIVTGNELTQQKIIMRQVQVRPERPLDLTAVEESRQRLESLRLFAPGSVRLTVQPPLPEDPRYRDVLVEVRETNTGEINFGVAYGSDQGVFGTIGLVQRNFDLFDFPDSPGELLRGRAFRGAGQTFRIQLSPGDRVQNYSMTLSEPYFLETDYSLSGSGFYHRRRFRQYDEERSGGRLALGRRFGTVWTGSLTLRNEWINLHNIDADAPVDFFMFEERQRLDSIGVRLTRSTVPPGERFRPTRGTRMEFGVEQAGVLLGDFDFTRFTAEYSSYFTLYESFLGYRTILKLDARAGYIPQSQDSVPVYERFFLGGQSFRGFGFRAVSPIGRRADGTLTREPVGGTWSWFMGAEVQQPIYQDIVSIAGFVDSGTVQESFGFDQYRVSVGFGFRIFVPMLSPVPLAFDFGFPILKEDTDRERIFTFSLDVPFQ